MIYENILTVDWEDWYQGNPQISYLRANEFESRIKQETETVLKLLKKNKVRATFFLLGHLAEKYPALVREIASGGHELASHGYSHRQLYHLKPSELREELRKTNQIIEKITGKKVIGFRASNWSINKSTWWAVKILKEEGFVYDSSIFPTKNYSYGIPDAPRFLYRHKNGLWEVPPATVEILNKRIPCCGGFFLRAWPSWFSQWAVRQINNENQVAVIHIHPWELDTTQPRFLPIPPLVNLIHYYNLQSTVPKLEKLFEGKKFITMKEYVEKQ